MRCGVQGIVCWPFCVKAFYICQIPNDFSCYKTGIQYLFMTIHPQPCVIPNQINPVSRHPDQPCVSPPRSTLSGHPDQPCVSPSRSIMYLPTQINSVSPHKDQHWVCPPKSTLGLPTQINTVCPHPDQHCLPTQIVWYRARWPVPWTNYVHACDTYLDLMILNLLIPCWLT